MTMAADGEAIWKKIDEIKAANPGNRCTKYLSKVRFCDGCMPLPCSFSIFFYPRTQ